MELTVLLGSILLSAILILAVFYYNPAQSSDKNKIPGLKPSDPMLGNKTDIVQAGSLHEFLCTLHDKLGPVVSFWMGKDKVYSFASTTAMASTKKLMDKPFQFLGLFEPLFTKKSMTYKNGEDAKKIRHLYDRCHSYDACSKMFTDFHKVIDITCEDLSKLSAEDHIPLRKTMNIITLRSIMITSLGDTYQDATLLHKFEHHYQRCWHELESRIGGEIPGPDSERQKNLDESIAFMHNQMREVVSLRKENPPPESEKLLVDVALQGGLSEEEVIADVITYIVGGFHTSGLMLTWLFYYLCKNQEIQDKVYDELSNVLGTKDQILTPGMIKELVYLYQVMDETLRCSTLAPYAVRMSEETMEVDGCTIPANSQLIQSLGFVLKDPQIWENPSKFDPERFSKENRKKIPNYAFEPFGFAGKRKCPGFRFAYTEVAVFLSVLLRKFSFRLVDETLVAEPVFGLVTNPSEEIWLKVEPRNK